MRQTPGFELNGNTGDLTANDCVINRKLMAQVPAGKNRSGQLSKQTGDAENRARRWLEGQACVLSPPMPASVAAKLTIMRDGTVTVLSKCATAVAPGT